jgi:hypothetical protein
MLGIIGTYHFVYPHTVLDTYALVPAPLWREGLWYWHTWNSTKSLPEQEQMLRDYFLLRPTASPISTAVQFLKSLPVVGLQGFDSCKGVVVALQRHASTCCSNQQRFRRLFPTSILVPMLRKFAHLSHITYHHSMVFRLSFAVAISYRNPTC